jgi:hypothetical protein
MPDEQKHYRKDPSGFSPNTTDIPDIIFDYLRTLTPEAFKAYYYIAYSSFAVPRIYPAPTVNKIASGCRLALPDTISAINELLEIGVIFGTAKKNPGFRAIGGQEHEERWPHERPESFNFVTGEGETATLLLDEVAA